MTASRLLARTIVLPLLAAALSGCIVLPYGAGGHRRGGYHAAPSDEQPVMREEPRRRHDRGPR